MLFTSDGEMTGDIIVDLTRLKHHTNGDARARTAIEESLAVLTEFSVATKEEQARAIEHHLINFRSSNLAKPDIPELVTDIYQLERFRERLNRILRQAHRVLKKHKQD